MSEKGGDVHPLYHVSEEPAIAAFHPRESPLTAPGAGPIVWAIDEAHLPNYLLPRDCPRVTFGPSTATTREDLERFGVGDGRVVVIEADWLRRVCSCSLHLYQLPLAQFRLFDETAGYWVTTEAVEPTHVNEVSDLPRAIAERGGELRVVHRLWSLHAAVAKSTLAFSMIRMRNALK